MTKMPWEYHRDLTEDRIIGIGALVATAYRESLEYYVESKGDTRWSHGCRRYEWARRNIRNAHESGTMPFLGILRDIGNVFEFKIGEVPVKFKRANPDEPDDSVIRQSHFESLQLSLLEFYGLPHPCELSWRLMVEDDYEGEVLRIVFAGIDEQKNTRCFWELPRERVAAHIAPVVDIRDEGVDMPAAHVGLRINDKGEVKQG